MKYAAESIMGIRPTDNPTIANVIGAVNPILDFEQQYGNGFILLAEHHATTTVDPHVVMGYSRELARTLIASGVAGDIYSQRQVSDLVFGVEGLIRGLATMTELLRTPALKDNFRTSDNPMNAGVDLWLYPTLMAADIILGRPKRAPAGRDQAPHLEIAKDLTRSFNRRHGANLPIPEVKPAAELSNILSLDGSGRKMSKSISAGAIFLGDSPDAARNKIMKAASASGTGLALEAIVDNFITIANGLASNADQEIVAAAGTIGTTVKEGAPHMGRLKELVGEVVANYLTLFQERRASVSDEDVRARVSHGTEHMREVGGATLAYMSAHFWGDTRD